MANQIITNKTPSVLDLSVIKDIHGNPVTLRPMGGPGDSREVRADAVRHEVVQNVKTAGWISINPVGVEPTAPFVAAPVDTSSTPVVEPPPLPEPPAAEPVAAEVIETVASAPPADDVQPVVEDVGPAAAITEAVETMPETSKPVVEEPHVDEPSPSSSSPTSYSSHRGRGRDRR